MSVATPSEIIPMEMSFEVRFCETDALQHVSNTALVSWFEAARDPIFRIFTPTMDLQNWPLILASYKVDFLAQIFLRKNRYRKNVYQSFREQCVRCVSRALARRESVLNGHYHYGTFRLSAAALGAYP